MGELLEEAERPSQTEKCDGRVKVEAAGEGDAEKLAGQDGAAVDHAQG